MHDMMELFAAHSPTPETMRDRCEIFFCHQMSICTLIKKPENEMIAFNHAHEAYEFMVPHTPIPFLVNEEAVYFGEVGWVFPVQSGRSHGMKYSLSDISHSNITIRKHYFESLLESQGLAGVELNYEFRLSDELKFYLDAFKAEFRKNMAAGSAMNNRKTDLLCELICLELIHSGADPELDTRKEKYVYQRGIHSVAQFLNDHYHQDISIEKLALMCGFSKNYFIRMFKKTLGESPYSYLNKLRISRAKLLLETTGDSIQEIAEKCGFQKANSFTSQFKTVTGMTPRTYRESVR